MGRLTLASLNETFRRQGIRDTLHRGKGYFYFTGPDADGFTQQGVYVNRLDALTEQQWFVAYRDLKGAQ